MEDLTNKILKADFSAKRNLLHNIAAKKISFSLFVGSTILFGLYHNLSPDSSFNSIMREGGNNPRDVFLSALLAEDINVRKLLRPEIYYRELAAYDKLYADRVKEFIGEDNKYKPFVWN